MESRVAIVIFGLLMSASAGNFALAQSEHEQHHPNKQSSDKPDAKEATQDRQPMGGGMHGKMMKEHMAPGGMMEKMHGKCPAMKQQDGAADMASLKSKLAITHAQNPAWESYEKALKNYYASMKPMPGDGQRTTALAYVQTRVKMMEQQIKALKAMIPVLNSLYETLTPSQRETGDKNLRLMSCKP